MSPPISGNLQSPALPRTRARRQPSSARATIVMLRADLRILAYSIIVYPYIDELTAGRCGDSPRGIYPALRAIPGLRDTSGEHVIDHDTRRPVDARHDVDRIVLHDVAERRWALLGEGHDAAHNRMIWGADTLIAGAFVMRADSAIRSLTAGSGCHDT